MLNKVICFLALTGLATTAILADRPVKKKEAIKTKANSTMETVKEKASDAEDAVMDKAADVKESVKSTLSNIASSVTTEAEWARAADAMKNSAIYMNLVNKTSHDVTLMAVSAAEVASSVSIHETVTDANGVSSMVELDKIVIPADKTVELTPKGFHFMLHNLKKPLVDGDKFEVTLTFDDKSVRTVEVEVKN